MTEDRPMGTEELVAVRLWTNEQPAMEGQHVIQESSSRALASACVRSVRVPSRAVVARLLHPRSVTSGYRRTIGEHLTFPFFLSFCGTKVARFNFRFVVSSWIGEKSLRVVADPEKEDDPCGTYQTDLSGLVTDLPVTNTGGSESFAPKDVDTSTT